MDARGSSRRPPGLEARERLEAFQAAQADVARAGALLAGAVAAHAESPDPAYAAGVELAQSRLLRASACLEQALAELASGRPPYEAFWGLPDDL